MAGRQLRTALQHFYGSFRATSEGTLSDAHLLQRWTVQRDEVAFELLLRRHGPMVFALCRRLLGSTPDAEDAFQATFLVLVRRAGAIHKQAALGSWLYKVAYRVALRARHRKGLPVASLEAEPPAPGPEPQEEVLWRDLRPVLDEEIQRLPLRYRDVFVLCQLEGKTNEQAARELGCPLGTVQSRLSRARKQLRCRLNRRGVTISAGALAMLLTRETAAASLPPLLAGTTLQHGLLAAGLGTAATQQIPSAISSLSQGVLQAMFLTKLKVALTVLVVFALTSLTGTFVAYPHLNAQEPAGVADSPAQPGEGTPTSAGEGWKEQKTLKAPIDPVLSLGFSPDNKLIVWGGAEGTLHIWSDGDGISNLTGHTKKVSQVAFSPDGKFLASAGLDGVIFIRDALTGKIFAKIQQGDAILAITFSPDGKVLASGGAANSIQFWDVPTGQAIGASKSTAVGVEILLYSKDGKYLASGGAGEAVLLWEMTTGKTQVLKQAAQVGAVAFSPDGKTMATGNEAGVISFLDVASGKVLREIKGHTKGILALAFSPDGKVLASSAKDQTIRLWDVATGKELSKAGQADTLVGLAISPDGKLLISGDKKGTIKIWDLKTGKQINAAGVLTPVGKGQDTLSKLVKGLSQSKKTDDECVEALFLATLGRFPSATELQFAGGHLAKNKAKREDALLDLVFMLTNTKEFVQHVQSLQQHSPAAGKLVWQKFDKNEFIWKDPLPPAFDPNVPVVVDPKAPPLLANPPVVNFGNIKVGQGVTQKVMVTSKDKKPFRIVSVKGSGEGLEFSWQDKTAPVHVLTISYQPDKAGKLNGTLTLQTDLGKDETLVITLQGAAAP